MQSETIKSLVLVPERLNGANESRVKVLSCFCILPLSSYALLRVTLIQCMCHHYCILE